jgi:hypothetical protein
MKNLTILIHFVFSIQVFSQILPAQHGVHDKKEGGSCSSSESLMGLPGQSYPYIGNVRGYHFTAPADFCITAAKVPTNANSGCQSVAIVRFNSGSPPMHPSNTNDFTQLHYTSCLDNTDKITVDISVSQGDVIGIYGCRGTNCTNSYGSGNYSTSIAGSAVTLYRSFMQYNLFSNQMKEISAESSGSISRVEMYYKN